jgi:glycosyltransferase involved in cell wall biosynthesis
VARQFSIICLSPQDWRVELPTNRQQIMLRVARRGHKVLFVETGHFLGRHLFTLVRGPERRSFARRLFSTEEVVPGVRLRKALNVLPWRARYRFTNAFNCVVTATLLRRLARGLTQPVVLWIYDPGSARMAGFCGEEFAVYDCVDDYAEQTNSARERGLLAAGDRTAALRSRLVFTTSTTMYERQRQLNAETHLVPNAGDYQHFARAADPSTAALSVARLPRPVLGFAGNFLASKVDFDLLEEVAGARPQWNLLLIGPASAETASALERLGRLSNVDWLGPKPYADLPRYVAAFDVGLIPYVSNAYTRSCFPLKLYEYLAAGKPVVATGLPELAAMEPDVVLVEGVERFLDAVEEALGHLGEADRIRRMRLASRNSWETRTERLLELVERASKTTNSAG